jgi:hypothetical protein
MRPHSEGCRWRVELCCLKQLQSTNKVIRLPLMQFEKAVGLLDDPRVDHGLSVNAGANVQPFGNFEPVP